MKFPHRPWLFLLSSLLSPFVSNIYFAGQLTGVEGYVESISSGLVAGLNAVKQYQKQREKEEKIIKVAKSGEEILKVRFPKTTIIGALANYISTENKNFQPMNANFGILPEWPEKIKDKKVKYTKLADKSLEELEKFINEVER